MNYAWPSRHISTLLYYFSSYLGEINVMHPFREGNGRAQRMFIEYLALVAGYRVDLTNVTAGEMIEASVRAFDRDESLMRSIFSRITAKISLYEQQAAIRAIAGARGDIMKIWKDVKNERRDP